VYILSMGHLQA